MALIWAVVDVICGVRRAILVERADCEGGRGLGWGKGKGAEKGDGLSSWLFECRLMWVPGRVQRFGVREMGERTRK